MENRCGEGKEQRPQSWRAQILAVSPCSLAGCPGPIAQGSHWGEEGRELKVLQGGACISQLCACLSLPLMQCRPVRACVGVDRLLECYQGM